MRRSRGRSAARAAGDEGIASSGFDADGRRRRPDAFGVGLDIRPRDQSGLAGRLDQREIDAEVFRELADRRGGPAPLGRGVDDLRGVQHIVRSGFEHRGVGGAGRDGCRERAGSPLRASGGAGRGPVADEVRCRLLGRGVGGLGGRCRRAGRDDLDLRLRRGRGIRSGHVEGDEHRADLDDVARLRVQGRHGTGEGRGQLDDRLGGLDLGDRLVQGDGVALGDEPLDELGLGKSFAEVGQAEFLDHSSTPARLFGRSRTRSTASRIRSRSGRWYFSSLAGG